MRRFSRREQILIGLCAVVALVIGLPALWDPAREVRRAAAAHRRGIPARAS